MTESENANADLAPAPDCYHAHVYFTEASRPRAARLRERLDQTFDIKVGTLVDRPVGPHPTPMFQASFGPERMAEIIPWLMWNHGELSVLIHPFTGEHHGDHEQRAMWLGPALGLKTEVFDRMRSAS